MSDTIFLIGYLQGFATREADKLGRITIDESDREALRQAAGRLEELSKGYAPPAIEVVDGVISDKSQDADWLRARYFEGTKKIEELEQVIADGCAREPIEQDLEREVCLSCGAKPGVEHFDDCRRHG